MNKIITTIFGAAVLTGIGYVLEKAMSEKSDKDDRTAKREEAKAEKDEAKAEAKAEAKLVVEEWVKQLAHYNLFRRLCLVNPSKAVEAELVSSRRKLGELMPKDLDAKVLHRNCLMAVADSVYLSDEGLKDLVLEEVEYLRDYIEARQASK